MPEHRRCCRLPVVLTLLLGTLNGRAFSEDLPITEVEFQPLVAQVRRVVEALEGAGESLPPEVKQRIEQAAPQEAEGGRVQRR